MIYKAALRRKYAAERAKRLRPDGNDQYQRLTGRFAHYAVDPYTPRSERAPVTDHVTVAFIGAGFAGLVTGARLTEAGVSDVRIVEKGGGVGGTWYWNRYPGAQCDTASFVYMPLPSRAASTSWTASSTPPASRSAPSSTAAPGSTTTPRGIIGSPDCTPGYYNNEGRGPSAHSLLSVGYPEGAAAYFEYIDSWRTSGSFDGLEFR